ncbi:ABC transporter permease [Telmatocola sphagniphila]|uniref:ABC transporter permease n=1 Tax=Telmatocola sphagniphila TaxID=1123043 RepID=A0A8E6B3R5_9BACT|nr:ABC transporter permease [Telmatocola sphagniphila]QVL31332.1 ABC transporter permease [Telmatocola sphagniphila]
MNASFRRLRALIRKEGLQIIRDPSTFLIAGVLPLVLLFIFGFGVSLDLQNVRMGVVMEATSPEANSLLLAFQNSRYFDVRQARSRSQLSGELIAGRLAGMVVIPADFTARLGRGDTAPIQLIVDGSEPNTAGLVQGYVQGVWQNWLIQENQAQSSKVIRPVNGSKLSVEPRFWYNADLSSRSALLPGAVAINLTLIGVLLTALVVAREWERGTMEGLLATPITRMEFLISKLLPYFTLGMLAMAVSAGTAVWGFGVPFRGSILALIVLSASYLMTTLSLGLLISTRTRNQFVACQAALIAGFLPAFELSGLLFEIDSMPLPIQLLTRVLPPRYFVAGLQTVFLAGDVPQVLVPNTLVLMTFATILFVLLYRSTRTRLEG